MKLSQLFIAIFLLAVDLPCFATGIIDEDKIREFESYEDAYIFSANAMPNWEILSATASGGGNGNWVASPPADGGKNYPRDSVSAVGVRVPGTSSAGMFSAVLSGRIRPKGSGGGSRTYTYSVHAGFKSVLSLEPATQIVPLWGNASQTYRLLSTYDGVAHHISGYWRTIPNRAGENSGTNYSRISALSYEAETRWPGVLTVEGSAHSDGGDTQTGSLRVVGVSSVKAVTGKGTSNESETISYTDGIQRNSYQEAVKDSSNHDIPEEIPTLGMKAETCVFHSLSAGKSVTG